MNRSSFATKIVLHVVNKRWQSRGYSLVVAVGTIVVLSTLLASYSVVSKFESLTAASSEQSGAGFYAAEAGLNLRAEVVRDIFSDFDIPSGTSEDIAAVGLPCLDGVGGTDDYSCITYQFQEFTTQTGLAFDRISNIVIPPGEPFQLLNAQEFRYLASSISYRNGDIDRPQAILGMNFLNRSVPLFQFMVFYDKDLEVTPGSSMTLNGPIHANANIFVDVDGGELNITDRVTVSTFPDGTPGDIFRQEKQQNECNSRPVNFVDNLGNPQNFTCVAGRTAITVPASFSERIQLGLPRLEVPPLESFAIGANNRYWALADLRIALVLNAGTETIEVRNVNNSTNSTLTSILNGSCSPVGNETVRNSDSFYNTREDTSIEMLEVDMQRLLDCIQANSGAFGFQLNDETQNGLVFYLTVIGPDSDNLNNYGVRLSNGSSLQSSLSGADIVNGLTVVSDQAAYIQGNYNSGTDWIPAAVISDSMNILSNAWSDFADDGDGENDSVPTNTPACTNNIQVDCPYQERLATDTTVFSAFLAGTTPTGLEGQLNAPGGSYQGGFENYPRLHEIWNDYSDPGASSQTLSISGSFISLGAPDHVDARWNQGNPGSTLWYYQQPIRNWRFDTRFRDPNQLPPMTPQATFLQQELFVRDFDR